MGGISDYCTLAQVRQEVQLTSGETSDDALLAMIIRRASRLIDERTFRWFYPLIATRYYDYPDDLHTLDLDADLLSCTSLVIDGTTTVAASDYLLYPLNSVVKSRIQLDLSRGYFFSYSDTRQKAIAVTGVWGWHDDYANAYEASGQAVGGTGMTDSSTTVTVASAAAFSPRQTIQIESELLMITAIVDKTLTVTRALNGTTAAAHTAGKDIYIYRPPQTVEQLAIRISAWLYRRRDAPFEKTATPALGMVTIPAKLPPDIVDGIEYLRRRV